MINKLDSLNIEKSLELFPEQVINSFEQGLDANVPTISANGVVVSGMGGSANAAKIIQGLYEQDLKIPFIVHSDYDLPAWVSSDTLVIVNSYSGNTEEGLSNYEKAKKIGAKVIGISTGGKIRDVVIDPKDTNPSRYPKSGLGVSLGALMGVLTKAKIINVSLDDLKTALAELIEIRKNWDAKECAIKLDGFLPVLFGGKPFIGSLNSARNAFCEISRNFVQFYDFPEVNHVLVEAMGKPDSTQKLHYIFFESKYNHPRVLLRYQITKKLLDRQNLLHSTYQLIGSSSLAQALELPHYCAWVGYHLSILQNTDPGPEPWIIELKEALSQPVH